MSSKQHTIGPKMSSSCCRICLKPNSNFSGLMDLDKISFNDVPALDVLCEMFSLKIKRSELSLPHVPRMVCAKCRRDLQASVDLWCLAWDSQWKIEAGVYPTDDSSTLEVNRVLEIDMKEEENGEPMQYELDEDDKKDIIDAFIDIEDSDLESNPDIKPVAKEPKIKPNMFPCDICSKRFLSKTGYDSHMATHTNNYRYNCKYCEKKFVAKQTMENHTRVHTKEKPYECNICKKKFPTSTAIKEHGRTHSDERSYKCSAKGCKKDYKNYPSLKDHFTKKHAPHFSYPCNMCKKIFHKKHDLQVHMVEGHSEVNVYVKPEFEKKQKRSYRRRNTVAVANK